MCDHAKGNPSAILENLVRNHPALAGCAEDIWKAYELIRDSYQAGGKLLLCGNGGSAADCEHIAGELMKGFLKKRPISEAEKAVFRRLDSGRGAAAEALQRGLPALSLVNFTSLNSAFANDVSAEYLFAQSVYVLGRPGDVLLGISTSGNARNVLRALEVASAAGLRTVGLTGGSGGAFPGLCDVCVVAPAEETYRVQEYHLPVYHALCAMLEDAFFAE